MHKPVAALAAAALVSVLVASGVGAQEPPDDEATPPPSSSAARSLRSRSSTPARRSARHRPGPTRTSPCCPTCRRVDYAGWKALHRRPRASSAPTSGARRAGAAAGRRRRRSSSTRTSRRRVAAPTTRRTPPSRSTASAPAATRTTAARILGDALARAGRRRTAVPPNAEDDGSIPLAGDTGIGTEPRRHHHVRRRSVTARTAAPARDSGDFDFYAVDARRRRAITVADIDTPDRPPRLDGRRLRRRRARWSPSTTTPAASTAC